MSTPLHRIIDEFSEEDQGHIERKARLMAEEMISHAASLAEVRSALVKTQDEVARVLNVKQNAVAQLEKRSDLLLSTLRKYVEAMGGELAVTVRTGSGAVIQLDSLSSLRKRGGGSVKSSPRKLKRVSKPLNHEPPNTANSPA